MAKGLRDLFLCQQRPHDVPVGNWLSKQVPKRCLKSSRSPPTKKAKPRSTCRSQTRNPKPYTPARLQNRKPKEAPPPPLARFTSLLSFWQALKARREEAFFEAPGIFLVLRAYLPKLKRAYLSCRLFMISLYSSFRIFLFFLLWGGGG